MPVEFTGTHGKIADTLNDILELNERSTQEVERIANVVGKEGKLKERMRVPGAVGGWADEITALNMLMDDLVSPTTDHALLLNGGRVVARGAVDDVLTDDVVSRCFGIVVRIHRAGGRWTAVHPAKVASR